MRKNISPISVVSISMIISLSYAIIRYNIFKGVPWVDLPLYVVNKGVALSSIILFSLYRIISLKSKSTDSKILKVYAMILGLLHLLISLIILSPSYFPKFYTEFKLNIIGELSLFFGVIAFAIILLISSNDLMKDVKDSGKINPNIGKYFLVFIAAHLFVMGYKGWLDPSSWPGWMPPITLLAFIIAITPMLYKVILKKNN